MSRRSIPTYFCWTSGCRAPAESRRSSRFARSSPAEEDVYQAITLGARGYVIKDNSPVNIIGALKKVMAGELAVSDAVRSAYEARKSERGLTGREKEILVLVSKGCSNTEIGDILHLSPNTVKNHLKNLFEALGAADRAEAVAIGLRRGLIS